MEEFFSLSGYFWQESTAKVSHTCTRAPSRHSQFRLQLLRCRSLLLELKVANVEVLGPVLIMEDWEG